MKIKEGEYENTEIDFLEDLSNAFGIDRASTFRYANFYYEARFSRSKVDF